MPIKTEKTIVKSTTDPDCGYINHERKKGLGYTTEMTLDTDSGIVLGVDCYSANRRESDIRLYRMPLDDRKKCRFCEHRKHAHFPTAIAELMPALTIPRFTGIVRATKPRRTEP